MLIPAPRAWRQVNPARAPEVVGALLDAEAPDEFVNNLILSVRSLIPVERLCAEVEQRNRMKLLSPFLEHLVSEGSQVPAPPPCQSLRAPHTGVQLPGCIFRNESVGMQTVKPCSVSCALLTAAPEQTCA